MVVIQYNFPYEASSVGEIRKPKPNHVILTIFSLCIIGTFVFIVIYFFHNEERIPLYFGSLKTEYTSKRLVCYYNFPSSKIDLQPQDIHAHLCSHVIVGFLNVNSTHELGVTQEQIVLLNKINHLKSENRDLKVLISVGGAGNVKGWPEMVYNHTNRRKFIRSVRLFLEYLTLDGVDLDWEYPNAVNINSKEKIHFTQLLEEFRMHINRNKYKFLISVAVPSLPFPLDMSYQVYYLNIFVDFINVMSYDFHFFSNLTPFTGFNSPLIRSSLDRGIFSTLNINDTVVYYQEHGMNKSKINVGLPTYGHTFTLFNQYNDGLYSPARGYGTVGNQGFASYSDIYRFLQSGKVMSYFDSTTCSPYATKELEWVSFDDNNSLTLKAQFLMERGFGGVMIYSLNDDDFNGTFGKKFTLTRAVKCVLLHC